MHFVDILLSLVTLIVLEIILGIDNLVILSILTDQLPEENRKKARRLGLTIAWVARLILLSTAFLMVKLVNPLFVIGSLSFSVRDLFLLAGGGFLIWKSTDEIHQDIAGDQKDELSVKTLRKRTFKRVIIQIVLLDIIFCL